MPPPLRRSSRPAGLDCLRSSEEAPRDLPLRGFFVVVGTRMTKSEFSGTPEYKSKGENP